MTDLSLSHWSQSIARFFGEPLLAETHSLRGLLRHHLSRVTEVLCLALLAIAAPLGLGSPLWFGVLTVYTAGWLGLDLYLSQAPGRMPQLAFRLAITSWPLAFVALGLGGWSGGVYHGEVVAGIAVLISGLIALVEPLPVAVLWALVGSGSVLLGAGLGGRLGAECLVGAGGVAAGAAFGNRLHLVLERYLGDRRRLLHDVTRVPTSSDPFTTAQALLEPIVRHTPMSTVSIVWFTADGRSVLLGIIGRNLPAVLRPAAAIPEHRNAYLRANAANGPWITGWAVIEGDEGYSRSLAAAGVDAVAYVPLIHEGRIMGLLTAAAANAAGGKAATAEQIGVLAEVADVMATTLGPAIDSLEERASATHLIEEVLRERRYWPVFQPIRSLDSNRVAGFEALTRFDGPFNTQRLFDQARLLGRGGDLEVATMKAAVKAAAQLPADCWVSVNASAALLTDTDTLAAILEPVRRPIVIELSEHELITDYEPISAAMRRLGPGCSLAVDDAGAGFASLRHILEVRPAYVKMDIGLVQGAATDLTRRALVAGFVHFARDAEFTLIAEGIENVEDLETLRRLGVAMGQGYLLGKPDRVGSFRTPAAASARRRTERVRAG